jgi:hypothetical protein
MSSWNMDSLLAESEIADQTAVEIEFEEQQEIVSLRASVKSSSKPSSSPSIKDATELTAKLNAQAGIIGMRLFSYPPNIEELTARFKQVQQLVKQQAGEIEVSNAEILRLQQGFGRSEQSGIISGVSPSSSRVTAAHGDKKRTGSQTHDSFVEEEHTNKISETRDTRTEDYSEEDFEEFPASKIQRPIAPDAGELCTPDDDDSMF